MVVSKFVDERMTIGYSTLRAEVDRVGVTYRLDVNINRDSRNVKIFLNEDARAYLVIDKLDRNVAVSTNISRLKKGEIMSLIVEDENINEPRRLKGRMRASARLPV